MIKEFNTKNGKFAFIKISSKNIPANNNEFAKQHLKDDCKMEVIGFVDELQENDWYKILDFVWVDCCDVCESGDTYYPNYLTLNYMDFDEDKYYYYNHWFINSEDSAKTLLDSLDINLNDNWLLIKYL